MIIKLNLAAPSIHLRQPITTNDHPVLIENDNNSELDPPHNLWGKTPISIFHNAIQFWFEWLLSPHTNIQIKHLINFCICLGSNPLSFENISLFCNMLMALEMSRKHGRKSLSAQLRAPWSPAPVWWGDTLGHVVTIHFICWMGRLQGWRDESRRGGELYCSVWLLQHSRVIKQSVKMRTFSLSLESYTIQILIIVYSNEGKVEAAAWKNKWWDMNSKLVL